MSNTMKKLVIGDGEFEIVDETARQRLDAHDTAISANTINIINVLSAGIDNTGSTDVSAKINELIKNGGCFYFPNGTYLLSTPLLIDSNTKIIGQSRENTIFIASATMDAVYHTICSKNAGNINARLARNSQANGYPAVDDVCSYYVENIYLSNFTVNGNWQNRNLTNWNKTCTAYGTSVNREYGTNVELQRVKNAVIDNVKAIYGIQHNINIRGGSGSYAMGNDYDALYPSEHCIVRNCICENHKTDDAITTHDSQFILIEKCHVSVSYNADGTYASAISNGIEIDDGSRYITVRNCISEYGFAGYQAKGHNNTPPAHDVTFDNCLSRYTHMGFIISCEPQTAYTDYFNSNNRANNITIKDCRIEKLYAFSNTNSFTHDSYYMMVLNAKNVKIKNLMIDADLPTNEEVSNLAATDSFVRCIRFRERCDMITIDGLNIRGEINNSYYGNTSDYFIRADGSSRNFIVKNVWFDGLSKSFIHLGTSSSDCVFVMDSVTGYIADTDYDIVSSAISEALLGSRTNVFAIRNKT